MINQYLSQGLEFLSAVISARMDIYFQIPEESGRNWPSPPPVNGSEDPLSKFVAHYKPSYEEYVMLMSALAPHIMPGFFDQIIQKYLPQGGEFPQFGGAKGAQHRGMLPTAETILFLLAGMDTQARLKYMSLFSEEHPFIAEKILSIEHINHGEPLLSGKLIIDREFVEVFTTGRVVLPKLSISFPAQHIDTQLDWEDLVLSESTRAQIQEIHNWVIHSSTLMEDWGMKKKLKPGFRALFYGPPGTGKTLTATLLGKFTQRPVFRVDTSTVVSKYIGETEKNLAALFAKAENKNWILFFDECDAIFGKRTGVRDAHDKYANQEVSYLLQRVESFSGLVILASNFRSNIDHAFIRRFNTIIYFAPPAVDERLHLWQNAFPQKAKLDESFCLKTLSTKYQLTGAQIMNVVQFVCLQSIAHGERPISMQDVEGGIGRELAKEGK